MCGRWIAGLCVFEWSILSVQVTLPSTNSKFATRVTPGRWLRLTPLATLVVAVLAAVYGVLFFCHNIEGCTVIIGLPFCAATVMLIAVRHRWLLRVSPVTVFFFVSHFVTLALFALWWHVNDGAFPEFSALKNRNFVNQFYANSQSDRGVQVEL